jgi:hypothetical protein
MMRRYVPIFISLLVVVVSAWVVVKKRQESTVISNMLDIKAFDKRKTCAIQPKFLSKLKVPQPIAVDLSQQQYRGVAFLFGRNLSQAVHPKSWTRFDHFSSYILDPQGNMYLTPMPYITVAPKTFEFQKSIYRLDSQSGELLVWMSIDEVKAGAYNPFGLIALDYDCDDDSLWVSAIDETDYNHERGVIYHIDIASKKILERVDGVDALSLKLVKSGKESYLLFGGARENALYALETKSLKIKKLFELPNADEHIRKIKVRGKNLLELQTIPFSYTLIAETGEDNDARNYYMLRWEAKSSTWNLMKK